MTVKPWSQPCPICGRLPCAWHEKGGLCDGEPQEDAVVVQIRPLEPGWSPIPEEGPYWLERLWAWLLDFPTPWS